MHKGYKKRYQRVNKEYRSYSSKYIENTTFQPCNDNTLTAMACRHHFKSVFDINRKENNVEKQLKYLSKTTYKNIEEVKKFLKSINPNLFITITFSNQDLSRDEIKLRTKNIFKKYYEEAYGRYWYKLIDSDKLFKFYLVLEQGKAKGNNHVHILLNSNNLTKEELCKGLDKSCLNTPYLKNYRVYTKNRIVQTKYPLNSIVIEDIYNDDVFGYLLKETNLCNLDIHKNFDNIISYKGVFTEY